ncbi:protein of unknown function [Moritella yayanosii]|uniref:Uncharacterized protein n=1 Tax=Moritella yayanosii TaxID=69539 RepID=A0A330LP93_9GAMM|nr:protein of unknown function [Moritella yayanosii]
MLLVFRRYHSDLLCATNIAVPSMPWSLIKTPKLQKLLVSHGHLMHKATLVPALSNLAPNKSDKDVIKM